MKLFAQPSASIGLLGLVLHLLALCGCSSSTTPQPTAATVAYPAAYRELLQKYVTPAGVRYGAWHANAPDVKKLKEVTDFYATTTAPDGSNAAALAWHLNAYNAWILQNILAQYPTQGPLDGDKLFFRRNHIVISGKKTSFNDLEQKVIRPTFKEPRIHFALNCASASCPALKATPFDAATLDSDLDELTGTFINAQAVHTTDGGKSVRLSKIFDWYSEDFGGKDKIISFINGYRASTLPPTSTIEFMDYDWSLNSAK